MQFQQTLRFYGGGLFFNSEKRYTHKTLMVSGFGR